MSQPHKICPRCQTPALIDAQHCVRCGHTYRTQFSPDPDRTILAGPDQPEYPGQQYEAPGYPAQSYPYRPGPAYGQPQAHNQQVHVHLSAPQTPIVLVTGSQTKTDPLAILSLVFGCLGMLFFCLFGWIFGLAGLGLGITSIVRVRNSNHLDGMPLAIAGIVLSSFPIVISLWAAVVMASAAANGPR